MKQNVDKIPPYILFLEDKSPGKSSFVKKLSVVKNFCFYQMIKHPSLSEKGLP